MSLLFWGSRYNFLKFSLALKMLRSTIIHWKLVHTSQKYLKLSFKEKRWNMAKYLAWNYRRFEFAGRPIWHTIESQGYSKYHSLSSPIHNKNHSNSIRYYSRKICNRSIRSETILGIRKVATFLKVINKSIFCNKSTFFKNFTNLRKKTNRVVVFSHRLLLNILNTRTSYGTFQRFGKQDSFRHILKSLASMYDSSGSLLLRSTNEIQLGPDAFDKSRLVLTFWTNLGNTGMFCPLD